MSHFTPRRFAPFHVSGLLTQLCPLNLGVSSSTSLPFLTLKNHRLLPGRLFPTHTSASSESWGVPFPSTLYLGALAPRSAGGGCWGLRPHRSAISYTREGPSGLGAQGFTGPRSWRAEARAAPAAGAGTHLLWGRGGRLQLLSPSPPTPPAGG